MDCFLKLLLRKDLLDNHFKMKTSKMNNEQCFPVFVRFKLSSAMIFFFE